jgi:hypothetical protein
MANQSVKNQLLAGNLENAAITITALSAEVEQETVLEFYLLWSVHEARSKMLEEFAQVYRVTGISPGWSQLKIFINVVYKVLKNKKQAAKNIRDVINVCYELLLKAERPEYFVKFYGCAGLEPATDLIYQAAMIARLRNEINLKKQICDTFQIVA